MKRKDNIDPLAEALKKIKKLEGSVARIKELAKGKNREELIKEIMEMPEVTKMIQEGLDKGVPIGEILSALKPFMRGIVESFLNKEPTQATNSASPTIDPSQFLKRIKGGRLEEVVESIQSSDATFQEQMILLYQWSLIAEDYGNKKAQEEMLNPQDSLDEDGGETIASAQFEVGRWYLLGTNGVEKDEKRAFFHLNHTVKKLKILEILDLSQSLQSIREKLKGAALKKFNALLSPK